MCVDKDKGLDMDCTTQLMVQNGKLDVDLTWEVVMPASTDVTTSLTGVLVEHQLDVSLFWPFSWVAR